MSEKKSKPELILEAIKILIWPIFIALAIFLFQKDVIDILKNRTWKFGIIEVGDRIETLHNDFKEELLKQQDYLEKIKLHSSDSQKVEMYATEALSSIKNIEKGVKKDIEIIQEVLPKEVKPGFESQPMVQTTSPMGNSAKFWEIEGFNKLANRDINGAINAFERSEKISTNYHNVYEIRRLLIREKDKLDNQKWLEIYKTILKKYSWGMPLDIQEKFKSFLKSKTK